MLPAPEPATLNKMLPPAGIDQGGEVILRDERNRTVVGQIDGIHPKRISPHESNGAGGSVKDIEGRILSYRIAHNGRDG